MKLQPAELYDEALHDLMPDADHRIDLHFARRPMTTGQHAS
jgi:hypothetical protein